MPECSRIDPLVTPFIDGELPPNDHLVVATHLADCPPCRARVAAERAVRTLMTRCRADLNAKPAPPELKTRCALLRSGRTDPSSRLQSSRTFAAPGRTGWRPRTAPAALAAALVLAIGTAFFYTATRSSSRVLAAELALDHQKCFRLNRLLGTHESADAVEASLASWFNWTVHVPGASGGEDLRLVGSRPCLSGEGKVAHIMYTHNGRPVSLFMVPGRPRKDQLIEVFGHQCRIWSEGDRTLVLVARESPSEMEELAASMRSTIR